VSSWVYLLPDLCHTFWFRVDGCLWRRAHDERFGGRIVGVILSPAVKEVGHNFLKFLDCVDIEVSEVYQIQAYQWRIPSLSGFQIFKQPLWCQGGNKIRSTLIVQCEMLEICECANICTETFPESRRNSAIFISTT
jgi:hypothetical protein